MGLREHGMRFGGLVAPDRNIERVDGITHSPASQIDPSEQEMRFCLVGRQKEGPPQLVERITIVFLFVQSPRAIEIKARELLLIALITGGERRLDLPGAWELDVSLDPLQPLWNGVGGRPLLPFGVGRREAARQL